MLGLNNTEKMSNKIYIRTSTEEQNPENQIKDCKEIAEKFNVKDYDILSDKQSAWKDHVERENFSRLKKEIMAGNIRTLIVWDLDRIYRNRKNLVGFFELCKINKCRILSYRQDWLNQLIKIPTPWDEIIQNLMIQIMGWMAQDESDKKSQRVKASIRIASDGSKTSYKGNKWGKPEIVGKVREQILQLRNEGKSLRDISKEVYYWSKSGNKKFVSLGFVHKVLEEYKEANPLKYQPSNN